MARSRSVSSTFDGSDTQSFSSDGGEWSVAGTDPFTITQMQPATIIGGDIVSSQTAPSEDVGGGIVVVPLLLLWLRFPTRAATATSLAAISLTAIAGTITYALRGDVRLSYAALVGLPAAAGAIGGTALQQRLRAHTVELLFAALLVGIAVWLVLK